MGTPRVDRTDLKHTTYRSAHHVYAVLRDLLEQDGRAKDGLLEKICAIRSTKGMTQLVDGLPYDEFYKSVLREYWVAYRAFKRTSSEYNKEVDRQRRLDEQFGTKAR